MSLSHTGLLPTADTCSNLETAVSHIRRDLQNRKAPHIYTDICHGESQQQQHSTFTLLNSRPSCSVNIAWQTRNSYFSLIVQLQWSYLNRNIKYISLQSLIQADVVKNVQWHIQPFWHSLQVRQTAKSQNDRTVTAQTTSEIWIEK